MGKKRRALAHPNKFKARARIMDRLRKIPTAPIFNSEAVEELQQQTAKAPEPVVETQPAVVEEEPVLTAEVEIEKPAPVKRTRPKRKKTTRTRRATTKKIDSSEA